MHLLSKSNYTNNQTKGKTDMSKINSYIGKSATHKILGLVKVLARVGKSVTIVEIECLQRAKGWDENSNSYKPIRAFKPNRNEKGVEVGKTFIQRTNTDSNSEYGLKDVSHIKDLILI